MLEQIRECLNQGLNPDLEGWSRCEKCDAPVPPSESRCWDHQDCPKCYGRGELEGMDYDLDGYERHFRGPCPDCGGNGMEQ